MDFRSYDDLKTAGNPTVPAYWAAHAVQRRSQSARHPRWPSNAFEIKSSWHGLRPTHVTDIAMLAAMEAWRGPTTLLGGADAAARGADRVRAWPWPNLPFSSASASPGQLRDDVQPLNRDEIPDSPRCVASPARTSCECASAEAQSPFTTCAFSPLPAPPPRSSPPAVTRTERSVCFGARSSMVCARSARPIRPHRNVPCGTPAPRQPLATRPRKQRWGGLKKISIERQNRPGRQFFAKPFEILLRPAPTQPHPLFAPTA
jgi:hypothetical protein